MSDFGTAMAQLKAEMGVSAVGNEDTALRHALINAIRVLERRNLPFNVASLDITTVVGVANSDTGYRYQPGAGASDLPSDFLMPLDTLYLRPDTSGTPNERRLMVEVTREEYDVRRAEASEKNGDPCWYCVIGKDLWVVPAADAITMKIIGRYIKRVETPTVTSGDAFTSDWFVAGDGLELVVAEAASMARKGYYENLQSAQGFAANADELLGSAVLVENSRSGSGLVRPYFIGER